MLKLRCYEDAMFLNHACKIDSQLPQTVRWPATMVMNTTLAGTGGRRTPATAAVVPPGASTRSLWGWFWMTGIFRGQGGGSQAGDNYTLLLYCLPVESMHAAPPRILCSISTPNSHIAPNNSPHGSNISVFIAHAEFPMNLLTVSAASV